MIRAAPGIQIEIETCSVANEEARAQHEQFDRNSAWLQAHIPEVYSQHRGKVICIAGEELFVGDTVDDVVTRATAAHPTDRGWFTRYIPKEKVARIYAV